VQRSGGKAGRPFGHLSIIELEAQAEKSRAEQDELTALIGELHHRKTKRATELRDLCYRLLRAADDEQGKSE
jgi:hypothetical protein